MRKLKYLFTIVIVGISSTYAAGPYIGFQLGAGSKQSFSAENSPVTIDSGSPFMYGINGGYDWAVNEKNTLGIYASYLTGTSNDSGYNSDVGYDVKATTNQSFIILAGQYQYNFSPEFGLFARLGFAYGNIKYEFDIASIDNAEVTPDGSYLPLVLGMGFEYAIAEKHGIYLSFDMISSVTMDAKANENIFGIQVNDTIPSAEFSAMTIASLGYRYKF